MHEPDRRPCIVLLAHDAKREDLVHALRCFRSELLGCDLVAAQGAAALAAKWVGLPVRLVNSTAHGGIVQAGALVASGNVDAVICLRDPLSVRPEDPDAAALVRLCDLRDVPVATNAASARCVLESLLAMQVCRSGGVAGLYPSVNHFFMSQ